jgi:hypothetical protein
MVTGSRPDSFIGGTADAKRSAAMEEIEGSDMQLT